MFNDDGIFQIICCTISLVLPADKIESIHRFDSDSDDHGNSRVEDNRYS